MRRSIGSLTTAVLFALLASCGGGDTVEPQATASGPASTANGAASATAVAVDPEKAPDAMITSPDHGETVSGSSVTVKLDVSNFDVVNKIGGKVKAGEGHVHFYLDVPQIPTTAGEEAIVEGQGRYVATSSTTHEWENLTPGQHTLGAQLVNNNHTPLQPPVTAQITITVES